MIEVYTRKEPPCPWCVRAKEKLNEHQLDYKEFVVGVDISRNEFVEKFWYNVSNPRPTVPQIVVNGNRIGGYEDLSDWLKSYSENGVI